MVQWLTGCIGNLSMVDDFSGILDQLLQSFVVNVR